MNLRNFILPNCINIAYFITTGVQEISTPDQYRQCECSLHVTYVTPFITDTYNFTLVSDAGNIWTFDGHVANNNMNPVGLGTYYYNNVALNAFQTYNVIVDYADWGGSAEDSDVLEN